MRRAMITAFCLLAARVVAADGDWVRTVDATVESKFVRRGIERAGGSVRPGAWLSDGAWKLGASLNLPFTRSEAHELAMMAGYTHAFDSGLQFGLEVTHFHFGDAQLGQPSHTAEVAATASFAVGPGRAMATLARDVNRRADIGELSFSGEYALKNWGAFLGYRVYVGAVEADDALPQLPPPGVEDSYSYHGADLTLPYRVGGQTVLTAGVHYAGTVGARPFWSPDGAAPGVKFWVSLAASYEF